MTFPFNITALINKAKNAQGSMQEIGQKLSTIEIVAQAGTENVMSVSISGKANGKDLKVNISNTAFEAGKQITEELIASAINDFISKMVASKKDLAKQEMDKLGIPSEMFLGNL